MLQEAQREVQSVCLEAEGIVFQVGGENQRLVSLLQAQESKFQSQTLDMNQM